MEEKKFAGNIMKMYLSVGDVPATMMDMVTTRDVLQSAGSSYGSGAWRTRLWSSGNRKYAKLRRAITTARTFAKRATLQSDVRGERFLKTSYYVSFSTKMQELEKKYWEAAKEFVSDYDAMVEEERSRLVGLADNITYPSKAEVERRFRFDLWYEGIPEGADILAKYGLALPRLEAESLARKVEEKTSKRIHSAMKDAYRQVFKQVHDMAVKLANDDVKFRSPLVSNLRDMVRMIPNLNITDDPVLDGIRKEIEDKLLAHSSAELMKDKDKRAKVATDALEITQSMASYFGRN